MIFRIMIGLLAAAFTAVAISTPATAQAEQPSAAGQQCRWDAPAQFGPRAAVRAAVWTCGPPARAEKACGRYEPYWPHWLSQRALPPVRRWVVERC